MKHKIVRSSEYAIYLLSKKRTGLIQSVYRKTINIQFDDSLIAIQAYGSPLSPISLISQLTQEEMSHMEIAVGDSVSVSGPVITILTKDATISFDLSYADLSDLSLREVLCSEDICKLNTNIKESIASSGVNGFATIFRSSNDQDLDLILNAARQRIINAKSFFHKEAYSDCINEICHLIGLGTGLTPSGDDFICGIFAGLILTGETNHKISELLKDEVSKHLTGTNPISGAFLKCSICGQFSQAICSLLHTPDSTAITEQFIQIGHSSGFDSLCGVYFVFSLFN